jgi:predicted nucleic acid-binding protein
VRAVVDASVAIKWYFQEPGSPEADALLAQAIDGARELLAPDLIGAEFANVLWKKIRLDECRLDEAHEIFELFAIDRPPLLDSGPLLPRALELAARLEQSVYDCLYLAAAIELEAALVTADRRLARAARALMAEVELIA